MPGLTRSKLDDIIYSLLEPYRTKHDRNVNLPAEDITELCLVAKDVIAHEPSLLELDAPIKVVGDLHGQYYDLLRHFDGGGFPPYSKYVFLGDYVDRGHRSIEIMCLLLAYKVKYPNSIHLLRGNHECEFINRDYGFYMECKSRYSRAIWRSFVACFNYLSVAAVIEDKIFCCHGGLSPDLQNVNQIKLIHRPTTIPDRGLLCDLLWADPDKRISGFRPSQRGVSFVFGADVVENFLRDHDFDLVCRAHQVVDDGYQFFFRRSLVTVFSAPRYCGDMHNAGAIMNVDSSLLCSFLILR